MTSQTRLLRALAGFVERVVDATSLEELEQRYLAGIGEHLPSAASGIYLHGMADTRPESFAARGVSDYYLARYERFGRERDPVLQRALRSRKPVDNLKLMTSEEWRSLPVYEEVFQLHNMVSVMVAPVVVNGETRGTLNFARTPGAPAFGDEDLRIAEILAQLFAVAIPSAQASIVANRRRDHLEQALDLCATAVVITDRALATRTMNPTAAAMLGQIVDGARSFETLLARIVDGGAASQQVGLTDGRTGVLRITAVTLDPEALVSTAFLKLTVDGQDSLPPAVHRQLTDREVEVVELAVAGMRDGEIAAQLFISPYTVKQHLKSAYRKLDIRSRVELTRLTAGSAFPGHGRWSR